MANAECRVPNAGCRLSDRQSPIANRQGPTSNRQWPIANRQCPTSNRQSRVPEAQCPMPHAAWAGAAMTRLIQLPLTVALASELRAGDEVELTGEVLTGRDQACARFFQ